MGLIRRRAAGYLCIGGRDDPLTMMLLDLMEEVQPRQPIPILSALERSNVADHLYPMFIPNPECSTSPNSAQGNINQIPLVLWPFLPIHDSVYVGRPYQLIGISRLASDHWYRHSCDQNHIVILL